jgi:hypothetical protein
MPIPRFTRQRALLAIAFAGGAIHAAQPALTQNETGTTETIAQPALIDAAVRKIADCKQSTPEIRAYYLLSIAPNCLINSVDGVVQMENTFETYAISHSSSHFLEFHDENMLLNFADSLSNKELIRIDAHLVTKEHANRADMVTLEALRQIDQSPTSPNRLYVYLAASRLFDKTGNKDEMHKCQAVLNESLRSAEKPTNLDEKQLKLASSILNSMAYALIHVGVPGLALPTSSQARQKTEGIDYTENEFKESEKLKLRAVALVDRLDATNFLRRKAHRDLALWYKELGKMNLAYQQKQILFKLVGREDESLMNPKVIACGQVQWFPEPGETNELPWVCGMG